MTSNKINDYRFRPKAEDDLDQIWEYAAEHLSVDQADAYVRGIETALKALIDFPESCRLRADVSPPVRLRPYKAHLIIYRVEGSYIDVVRILYKRRNWQALIEE